MATMQLTTITASITPVALAPRGRMMASDRGGGGGGCTDCSSCGSCSDSCAGCASCSQGA